MKILIVEDDHLQADWIRSGLADKKVIGAKVEIIKTESEFQSRFEEIAINPPHVIVIDVMLRWCDPSRNMPTPPPQVKQHGFYRAGFRCQRKLESDERTKHIPIIFYTVLTGENLKPDLPLSANISLLMKDSEIQTLCDKILELFRKSTHLKIEDSNNSSRIKY